MTHLYSLRSTRIQASVAALAFCFGAVSAQADPGENRGGGDVIGRTNGSSELRDLGASGGGGNPDEADARASLRSAPLREVGVAEYLIHRYREASEQTQIRFVSPYAIPLRELPADHQTLADLTSSLSSAAFAVIGRPGNPLSTILVPTDFKGRLGMLLLREDVRKLLSENMIDPTVLSAKDLHSAAMARAQLEIAGFEKDHADITLFSILKRAADSKIRARGGHADPSAGDAR
jgi:hypothetical protein